MARLSQFPKVDPVAAFQVKGPNVSVGQSEGELIAGTDLRTTNTRRTTGSCLVFLAGIQTSSAGVEDNAQFFSNSFLNHEVECLNTNMVTASAGFVQACAQPSSSATNAQAPLWIIISAHVGHFDEFGSAGLWHLHPNRVGHGVLGGVRTRIECAHRLV